MILGLTGGIASGKSAVANYFAELGAQSISADDLAREVVAPGSSTLEELVTLFGLEILTPEGRLDRKVLAQRVFAEPALRHGLESITLPAIAHLAEWRLAELRGSGHSLVVYEAPLLFEAKAEGRVDHVLVVLVEPTVQLDRLMHRDGLSEVEARQRVAAQWLQVDKVQKADFVIDNSNSMATTRGMVAALYRYLTRQGCPGSSSS